MPKQPAMTDEERKLLEEYQRRQGMTHTPRTDAAALAKARDIQRGGLLGLTTDVLGMPVDMASMLVPQGVRHLMPEKIPGGSDWLRQQAIEQGLIDAPAERSGSEMLGGLLTGLISPAKAATAAKGLLGAVTAAAPLARVSRSAQTVMRPQRNMFPGVYGDPRELVAEAASRVAPESPLLKQLFGVTREDLWNIGEQGQRQGNIVERPFKAAANPKGAAHTGEIMNPRNERRLLDLIGEAQKRPELARPMESWYVMDPMYQRMVELHGADKAPEAYRKYNALVGMASPSSDVETEINRGTAANWLANQDRFADFMRYGNAAGQAGAPADMAAVLGHAYHSTAQAPAMEKFLRGGAVDMGSAKVPSYIAASGVPEIGFQTQWPVGDAHFSRLIGLSDVRGTANKASASVPEMIDVGPWWKERIAAPSNLESVPAQGLVWGAGSGATGVTSPIGAGKLELTAMQMGEAAKRMGVTPETARDMILLGKGHAGEISPELAAWLAAGATGGLLGNWYLQQGAE